MEFRHQTITTPVVTPEDCIHHGLATLTYALTDAPTSQSYSQHQSITALCDASNSWSAPNEKPDPAVPIPIPAPDQTRRDMKILKRKLKQPPITLQPNTRVPNELAPCEPDPRRKIQQHLPAPSPRVNPKDTPPEFQPIACRTMSHTKNAQPPIDLLTRAQLQQSLTVKSSQASQRYFPKSLLALWSNPATALSMPVINAETGESLE